MTVTDIERLATNKAEYLMDSLAPIFEMYHVAPWDRDIVREALKLAYLEGAEVGASSVATIIEATC